MTEKSVTDDQQGTSAAPAGSDDPQGTSAAPAGSDDPQGTSEAGDEDTGSTSIKQVRREAANWRTKYRDAEKELNAARQELFNAQVKATGRLADASDMEMDPELIGDNDALNTAIDELLERKPHLKARSFGNAGQHERQQPASVSLGSILRSNA